MQFSRFVAMLPAFGFVAVIASVEAETPRRDTGLYSVQLVDDSRVIMQLLTDDIEVTTAYGSLKVPVGDIRSIDFGLRYPDGVEKQIGAAIARLGDANFEVREAAAKELLQLKELVYPALRRAAQSENPEVKRQAISLVRQLKNKLTSDQLKLQENDVIVATRFPITGRIKNLCLKGQSRVFGDIQLQMAEIRKVQSLTVESETVSELVEPIRAEVQDWTIRSPDLSMYEVLLADGSIVDMRLISKEIEITSREGKIKVPVGDIRSIDFGLRYPDGVEKQIGAAIARLGDANFEVREAAAKELLQLEELAYLALERAAQSTNFVVKQRATELVRELEDTLPSERLEFRENDALVTTGTTITGRIEGLTLKVHSRLFGEVQLQLSDTRQMRSLTAELVSTRALLERVRDAVGTRRTIRSQKMGSGKESYEEVPKDGALLIGFDLTYGKFRDSPTVTTFRPIFLTRTGRVLGTTHGNPGEDLIRVEAKPGYAVGAVTIKAGLGVDGMSVTFMEIGEGGLNPNRAYESEWLGGFGGGPETMLGGTGAPVVGIFGATAEGTSTFNGLGLIWAECR
jgi:hypothetical protein